MGIFPLIGISNFERRPKADLFIYLFIFYIRAQFVAKCRHAHNVILANLWIKCLQCGNNLIRKRKQSNSNM